MITGFPVLEKPGKSKSTPTKVSLSSVLLPERLTGFPACTFGPRPSRASPESDPPAVSLPEIVIPSAVLSVLFPAEFISRSYLPCDMVT